LLAIDASLGDISPDLSFTEFEREREPLLELKPALLANEFDLVNPMRKFAAGMLPDSSAID
jgi:hypothetical protein